MSVELVSRFLNNADAVVKASEMEGVPLHIVCAFVQQESNGNNVYGKDEGGVFSASLGTVVEVTEKNFAEFRERVANGEKTNGVGLMQITWPAFFGDAEVKGFSLWKPLDNIRYGLLLVKSYLNGDYSLENLAIAASVYNTGSRSRGVNWYGEQVAAKALHWKALLENPPQQFDQIEHKVVAGDTMWGISRKYTVGLLELLAANPNIVPEELEIGSIVKIPVENYIVQSGDSLWRVYRNTGTSIDLLAKFNNINLDDYEIHPGQVLRVR